MRSMTASAWAKSSSTGRTVDISSRPICANLPDTTVRNAGSRPGIWEVRDAVTQPMPLRSSRRSTRRLPLR